MALPKWSSHHPQALHIGESTIIIPPQTGIMPSLLAVQTHPKYWPDPLVWQPSRWISSPASQPELDITTQLLAEALITPMQSKYFPWSDGPQNCPGAKFAQVEFVAVIAGLLRDHRIDVIPEANESMEKARKRALATTEDCDMELLLRMRNADRGRLVLKRV